MTGDVCDPKCEPTQDEIMARWMYETYCEQVGGKAYDGKPLPTWAEFYGDFQKAKQANGWIVLARRTLTMFGLKNA